MEPVRWNRRKHRFQDEADPFMVVVEEDSVTRFRKLEHLGRTSLSIACAPALPVTRIKCPSRNFQPQTVRCPPESRREPTTRWPKPLGPFRQQRLATFDFVPCELDVRPSEFRVRVCMIADVMSLDFHQAKQIWRGEDPFADQEKCTDRTHRAQSIKNR